VAIAGTLAVGGAVTAIVVVFARWWLKHLDDRRAARIQLIADIRKLPDKQDPSRTELRELHAYARIRPHLPQETVWKVEGKPGANSEFAAVPSGRRGSLQPHTVAVLDDLARLEKQWRLI
jgi:hypothetical protein